MKNLLYMVIPCYNEEEVLPETAGRLREKMNALIASDKIDSGSRVVFVNDGSTDRTWEITRRLHREDRLFSGINLSRNCGHQRALLAGLLAVRDMADMTISMDADLQDDIDAIDRMVDKYLEGSDVVYGVRSERKKDTFFKKFTAEGFYKLLNSMGGEVVFNHADYRLLSRRALSGLSEYGESNLFLRGIIPMIGYKSATVTYERGERFAGESKYPLGKMLSLAIDGITSLSIKPIRAVLWSGVFLQVISLALFIFSLVRHFSGYSMLGWKIITFSVLFTGGLILISLGIIGEYVGKTYVETKKRPRFFIESILHEDKNN